MEEYSREQLEDENELLKQQLSALTGSSAELGVLMSLRHGMTQRLAQILYILVNRSPATISKNTLHTLVYGDRHDGGPEPIIFANYVSRLKAILRRLDCPGEIVTVWNAGYRADPKLVKWVKKLYDQHIPKEK